MGTREDDLGSSSRMNIDRLNRTNHRSSSALRNVAGPILTDSNQLLAREQTARKRWNARQQEWDSLQQNLARKHGRSTDQTVVSSVNNFREQVETFDILQKALPKDECPTAESWMTTLRGGDTRYIPLGNEFSGLYVPVIEKPRPLRETVRSASNGKRPAHSDASATQETKGHGRSRRNLGTTYARTWQNNPAVTERKQQLEENIRKLRPYVPDEAAIDRLMISTEPLFAWASKEIPTSGFSSPGFAQDSNSKELEKPAMSSVSSTSTQEVGSLQDESDESVQPCVQITVPRSFIPSRRRARNPLSVSALSSARTFSWPNTKATTSRLPGGADASISLTCLSGVGHLSGQVARASVFQQKRSCAVVVFENIGPNSLYFTWKRIFVNAANGSTENGLEPVKSTGSSAIVPSRFICDKLQGSLIPGASISFSFSFHSTDPGSFSEIWQCDIFPTTSSTRPFQLMLQGIAEKPHHFEPQRQMLDKTLVERGAERVAREALQEIVRRVRTPTPPPSGARLRALQSIWFRRANKGLVYDPICYDGCLELYDQCTSTMEHVSPWNSSLQTLYETCWNTRNISQFLHLNALQMEEAKSEATVSPRSARRKSNKSPRSVKSMPNKVDTIDPWLRTDISHRTKIGHQVATSKLEKFINASYQPSHTSRDQMENFARDLLLNLADTIPRVASALRQKFDLPLRSDKDPELVLGDIRDDAVILSVQGRDALWKQHHTAKRASAHQQRLERRKWRKAKRRVRLRVGLSGNDKNAATRIKDTSKSETQAENTGQDETSQATDSSDEIESSSSSEYDSDDAKETFANLHPIVASKIACHPFETHTMETNNLATDSTSSQVTSSTNIVQLPMQDATTNNKITASDGAQSSTQFSETQVSCGIDPPDNSLQHYQEYARQLNTNDGDDDTSDEEGVDDEKTEHESALLWQHLVPDVPIEKQQSSVDSAEKHLIHALTGSDDLASSHTAYSTALSSYCSLVGPTSGAPWIDQSIMNGYIAVPNTASYCALDTHQDLNAGKSSKKSKTKKESRGESRKDKRRSGHTEDTDASADQDNSAKEAQYRSQLIEQIHPFCGELVASFSSHARCQETVFALQSKKTDSTGASLSSGGRKFSILPLGLDEVCHQTKLDMVRDCCVLLLADLDVFREQVVAQAQVQSDVDTISDTQTSNNNTDDQNSRHSGNATKNIDPCVIESSNRFKHLITTLQSLSDNGAASIIVLGSAGQFSLAPTKEYRTFQELVKTLPHCTPSFSSIAAALESQERFEFTFVPSDSHIDQTNASATRGSEQWDDLMRSEMRQMQHVTDTLLHHKQRENKSDKMPVYLLENILHLCPIAELSSFVFRSLATIQSQYGIGCGIQMCDAQPIFQWTPMHVALWIMSLSPGKAFRHVWSSYAQYALEHQLDGNSLLRLAAGEIVSKPIEKTDETSESVTDSIIKDSSNQSKDGTDPNLPKISKLTFKSDTQTNLESTTQEATLSQTPAMKDSRDTFSTTLGSLNYLLDKEFTVSHVAKFGTDKIGMSTLDCSKWTSGMAQLFLRAHIEYQHLTFQSGTILDANETNKSLSERQKYVLAAHSTAIRGIFRSIVDMAMLQSTSPFVSHTNSIGLRGSCNIVNTISNSHKAHGALPIIQYPTHIHSRLVSTPRLQNELECISRIVKPGRRVTLRTFEPNEHKANVRQPVVLLLGGGSDASSLWYRAHQLLFGIEWADRIVLGGVIGAAYVEHVRGISCGRAMDIVGTAMWNACANILRMAASRAQRKGVRIHAPIDFLCGTQAPWDTCVLHPDSDDDSDNDDDSDDDSDDDVSISSEIERKAWNERVKNELLATGAEMPPLDVSELTPSDKSAKDLMLAQKSQFNSPWTFQTGFDAFMAQERPSKEKVRAPLRFGANVPSRPEYTARTAIETVYCSLTHEFEYGHTIEERSVILSADLYQSLNVLSKLGIGRDVALIPFQPKNSLVAINAGIKQVMMTSNTSNDMEQSGHISDELQRALQRILAREFRQYLVWYMLHAELAETDSVELLVEDAKTHFEASTLPLLEESITQELLVTTLEWVIQNDSQIQRLMQLCLSDIQKARVAALKVLKLKGRLNQFLHIVTQELPIDELSVPDTQTDKRPITSGSSKRKSITKKENDAGEMDDTQTMKIELPGLENDQFPMDLGAKSRNIVEEAISQAGSIVWAGLFGVAEIEEFQQSTQEIIDALFDATRRGCDVLIAGESSAAWWNKMHPDNIDATVFPTGPATRDMLAGFRVPIVDGLVKAQTT